LQCFARIARHVGIIDDGIDPVEMALISGKSKEVVRQQQIKDLSTAAGQDDITSRGTR
jgi:hypothetical protein